MAKASRKIIKRKTKIQYVTKCKNCGKFTGKKK